jgi:DNA invertase Pin-like site-specific DNA recombinase
MNPPTARRAIGIIRCSPDELNQDKRSPEIQRRSIKRYCDEQGWELLYTLDEVDVSGRWDLERRTGLLPAVQAIENKEANVIIVARFDRLVRNVRVQADITERVEQAGGDLFAIDSGFHTNGNATQKLTSNFLGMVAQYHSDTTKERVREAMERAIAQGIPLFRGATLGYQRPVIGHRANGSNIHGPLVPDPVTKDIVAEAWKLRADGATVAACRDFLAERGVETSYPGLIKHFKSRLVLGELHHGKTLQNLSAHPPIVDREIWQRVQDMRSPSGRRAQSEQLLSRLNVLRCANCGRPMSVGNGGKLVSGEHLRIYACSSDPGECLKRSTITAEAAETKVWEAAKVEARNTRGRAAAVQEARDAEEAAVAAEARLGNLIAMLSGFEDVGAAREQLEAAKAEASALRSQATRLASRSGVEFLDADDPRLTLDERRAIVAATIERAMVVRAAPGLQGAARITVEPFSQDSPSRSVEHAL